MRASGTLKLSDYLDNADALLSDPDYADCTADLLDLSAVENIELSSADIDRITRKDREFGDMLEERKLAIVASGDIPFGFARMYGAQSNSTFKGLHVFRCLEDALEWLGIPAE